MVHPQRPVHTGGHNHKDYRYNCWAPSKALDPTPYCAADIEG